MERISRSAYYMGLARLTALRGSCKRLQVGCTIIKEGRSIVSGYNGPVSTNCTGNCNTTIPCTQAIHAEANAIAFSAKHGIALMGATIYVTHSPCIKCAELIIQAGIKKVIYEHKFRDIEGLLLLNTNGVITSEYEEQV